MLSNLRDRLAGLKSFHRGVHPPHRKKLSEGEAIHPFVPKADMIMPMAQHIGAACEPTVKSREEVEYAQIIGNTDSFVSAPIHASVNGKTAAATVVLLSSGRRVPAIGLKPGETPLPENFMADFLDRNWDHVEPNSYEPDAICQAIRDYGVVGLGGATFPTHIKLKKNPNVHIIAVAFAFGILHLLLKLADIGYII